MKRIIFVLLLSFFASCVFASTPIASKQLGVDSVTGLNKEVQVWQLTIDSKAEKIVVVYDVVLLATNGKVANVLETGSYERYNKYSTVSLNGQTVPSDMRFDQYRNSQLGVAISQMIQQTINQFPNTEQ